MDDSGECGAEEGCGALRRSRSSEVGTRKKDQGFPFGTLLDAVDFYTQHHDPAKAKRTVQKANRRPNTIRDLHQRIGRFAQDFGNRLAHEQSPIGRKVELLQKEGVRVKNGRVENFREHLHVFST